MKRPYKKRDEHGLQTQIIQYLLLKGHFVWRNNTGALVVPATIGQGRRFVRYGKVGSSDILGCHATDGRLIAVEVKDGNNKPTAEQELFMREVNCRGGIAFPAYSLDDVIKQGL